MKRNAWIKQIPFTLIVFLFVITIAGWQQQPGKTISAINDTIPDKNKIKNIDGALEQLEKSQKEMERTMQQKDWGKERKEALDNAHLNAQKMQEEIQKAMKEANFEKMKMDLKRNLDKIDLVAMKTQLADAMKQIDVAKIKADMDASVSKIDMDKIRLELDKIKDINFNVIEENMKKVKPEIEKSIRDAKKSVEKAKRELLEYQNFINGLDRDGLIDKNREYKIEYKNGELMINDKKQPAEVVKKYSSFLRERKDFTIKKDKDNFTIDN